MFTAMDTAVSNSMRVIGHALQTGQAVEGYSMSETMPYYRLEVSTENGAISLTSRLRSDDLTNVFYTCDGSMVGRSRKVH